MLDVKKCRLIQVYTTYDLIIYIYTCISLQFEHCSRKLCHQHGRSILIAWCLIYIMYNIQHLQRISNIRYIQHTYHSSVRLWCALATICSPCSRNGWKNRNKFKIVPNSLSISHPHRTIVAFYCTTQSLRKCWPTLPTWMPWPKSFRACDTLANKLGWAEILRV